MLDFFCCTSAAESCKWGGVDGCEAAEPEHRSNAHHLVPTEAVPRNRTSAHLVPVTSETSSSSTAAHMPSFYDSVLSLILLFILGFLFTSLHWLSFGSSGFSWLRRTIIYKIPPKWDEKLMNQLKRLHSNHRRCGWKCLMWGGFFCSKLNQLKPLHGIIPLFQHELYLLVRKQGGYTASFLSCRSDQRLASGDSVTRFVISDWNLPWSLYHRNPQQDICLSQNHNKEANAQIPKMENKPMILLELWGC